MKKVLLTGATGFIGRAAIPLLLSKGFEVHAVARTIPESNELAGLHWHSGDLLDHNTTEKLVAKIKPKYILHFAWYSVPKKYGTSAENIRWVQASLALLQAFVQHGGKRIVMAGTCAEYDWNYGYCSEKVTPCVPDTLYGICKLSLQNMLTSFAMQSGISAAWGRIFFLYGPHEEQSRLVSSVITSLLKKETANCSEGSQLRDFMHVEDVVSAFIALLETNVEGVVNICSGKPYSIKDVATKIARQLKSEELLQFATTLQSNEPSILVGDNRRLKNEVNWVPLFDLDNGIAQTIEWWKTQTL